MRPAGEARPLPPGSTIGILGGGQLGRMLALAAARLGLRTHVYCPDPASPAFDVAAAHTVADYRDEAALAAFAGSVDVVTTEFENVPAEALHRLAGQVPVRPDAAVLAVTQDRLSEKRFLAEQGIRVAPHAAVTVEADLAAAGDSVGFPAILKTRRFGYDGKGQRRVRSTAELAAAFASLGRVPAVLEAVVTFDREVSVVLARGLDGSVSAFDPTENEHQDGILRRSRAPATFLWHGPAAITALAARVAHAFGYVGVLAVEFFVIEDTGGHTYIANEIAPRVHNSGHWTEDACLTSQFEQHIRAVAGWPLGPTTRFADAEMENLIGTEVEAWAALAADPAARLHLYGKREVRAGRKMGHVNRLLPLSEDPNLVWRRQRADRGQAIERDEATVVTARAPVPPAMDKRG